MIQVENLGKQYVIRHQRPGGYETLRDRLTDQTRALGRRMRRAKQAPPTPQEEFWALQGVNLTIQPGEVVGIIGRNGAGKSTLLKILSRITEPTTGRIVLEGRVASLLEVGTGFHAELTGRENIYLNGAILGMGRIEIKRKFDEIVAFAEVEKFLDTPVKRYSSGMYVRLAFAVAAHLEPEILIVDEVLAVGDAAFQKKCLGKMSQVSNREGRTVLFVSHNMSTVSALCSRAYLLEQGKLATQGPTATVISQYLRSVYDLMVSEQVSLAHRQDRLGDGSARITAVSIRDADGQAGICVTSRLQVTIAYRSEQPIQRPQFSATIYDYAKNVGMISLHSETAGGLPDVLPPVGTVTCITEPLYLTPGRCHVNLALLKAGARADYIQYAAYFDIEGSDIYGTGKLPERDWVFSLRHQTWSVDGERP